jgi:hypothetical protein
LITDRGLLSPGNTGGLGRGSPGGVLRGIPVELRLNRRQTCFEALYPVQQTALAVPKGSLITDWRRLSTSGVREHHRHRGDREDRNQPATNPGLAAPCNMPTHHNE